MSFASFKNFLVPILILGLFLPIGLALFPDQAEAQMSTVEAPGALFWNTIKTTIESTITAIKTSYLAFKAAVLDPIGWNLSTMIIQAITAAIVDWINSGFQGSPAFVQNLQDEFLRVANLEFEKFLRSNDLDFMCYPQSIRLSLILNHRGNQFRKRAQCTITRVVSNVQGFMNGDWAQGGLAGFVSLSRAENNPYMANIVAEGELSRRIAEAVGIKDKKLQAGRLFKSFEVCEDVEDRVCAPGGGDCQNTKRPVCRITTPGDVIATQLNKALALGEDKLVVAQSIDQIVSALLAQLARMALTGSGGLYGLSNSSYNGGAPYTNQLASTNSSSGGAGSTGLLGAIEEGIRTESEYRDQKRATLNLYAAPSGAEGKALEIISCYNGKLNSRTLSLSGNDIGLARTRIAAASSTLATVILPKKTPLAQRVASSTEIISAFSLLGERARATTSPEALSRYATEYSSLSSRAHTRSDLVEAEREFNEESANLYDAAQSRPGDPLNGLGPRLATQMTECRAFPQTEGGGGNN
ncbi:MAG TPA: hypothetical protein VD967_01460 [Candidatus Paceibacterota bacterium]|nr:hypothetical protein [Candidatus Paceibacterota bacterium]